jgi:ribosomal 50S subunit-recycling heat shock protein
MGELSSFTSALSPPLPQMRLDIFLKLSRLVPRRTLAQEMCEAGVVKVNGLRAKSAHEVRPGDLLSIRQRGRITTVRVVNVPAKPPSKREAPSLFETISIESVET